VKRRSVGKGVKGHLIFKLGLVHDKPGRLDSRDEGIGFIADVAQIVDGGFQQTAIAIAIPKNRPNALAYVTAFLESAKASGSVRRALDKAGFPNEPVAP